MLHVKTPRISNHAINTKERIATGSVAASIVVEHPSFCAVKQVKVQSLRASTDTTVMRGKSRIMFPIEIWSTHFRQNPGSGLFRHWRLLRGIFAAVLFSVVGSPWSAGSSPGPRVRYQSSIVEVPTTNPAGPTGSRMPRIARASLTAGEAEAPMDFEVMLAMRNFAELQERVSGGEIIPREEMIGKYFPLQADYDAAVGWLTAQGFAITLQDDTRLSVFARGSVSRVAEVFQATFARVAADGAEYTSAITAPSLPMSLAPALLGVGGLQPHLRAHKHASAAVALPLSLASNSPPYTPAQILGAYGGDSLGLDGSGQTIAIVIDVFPAHGDLTGFWSRCGVGQSLANIQEVQVINGSLTNIDATEATIDVELASSVAPAATIRIYATIDLESTHLDAAFLKIYNDLQSHPSLHQLNLSFGSNESDMSASEMQSEAQRFATLASAGVTVFASSGDGGSNPSSATGYYSSRAPAQPGYPASDPSVTGVGGTSLILDPTTGAWSSETGWSVSGNGSGSSGGGISTFFARPTWQVGPGVPVGSKRLVPDVSAVGDPSTGCLIWITPMGSTYASFYVYGGTSVSTPIWTGLCALLNQAQAAGGQAPLGLLGPHLYPLIGSSAFHDLTSGTNGAYSAGSGYDLVTGIGTPIMAPLVRAVAPGFGPAITAQPVSQTAMPARNVTFSVTATGSPAPTDQWQREPTGTATWANLADGAVYSGSATSTLTVASVTAAMDGDQFRCVITNTFGSVTTNSALLVVATPMVVTTLAGQPGVGGSTDGTGSAALFNHPADLATDSSGNVYVADTNNDTIRRITPAGAVTTIAGLANARGSTDGVGSAARFSLPTGIGIDSAGNLYVADTGNNTIRKITSAGAVTTLAGLAGASGSADATGSAARFNAPSDVGVDPLSNLYVTDSLNDTIRKITTAGAVTTAAGLAGISGSADGDGSAARLFAPEGIAPMGSGNSGFYAADTNNNAIRKIQFSSLDGSLPLTTSVTTIAGLAGVSGSSDGIGAGARFFYPADVAVDGSGNVFVIDTDNHTIREITVNGVVGTVAGLSGSSGSTDGTGSAARFFYPTGIAVDASGNVYVADTNNNTIRKAVPPSAPAIQIQPQSQTVTAGANVSFSVAAIGAPAPTYQWYFAGASIPGATDATLTLTNVQSGNTGSYTVTVSNSLGSVSSNAATLAVNAASTPSSNGGGGGGGGGGAPSLWFLGAIVLLAAARWVLGSGHDTLHQGQIRTT
jgi:kumamolisin